ncbi:MAG TPA: S8/S53 family peptidase, partial [Polyangiaceae bacterium]
MPAASGAGVLVSYPQGTLQDPEIYFLTGARRRASLSSLLRHLACLVRIDHGKGLYPCDTQSRAEQSRAEQNNARPARHASTRVGFLFWCSRALVVGCTLGSSLACSGQYDEEGHVSLGLTAPVSCSGGTLLPLGDYTFDYSGRQITGRVCARPDGLPPEDVWTEVGSSARVDFAALEQEDAWALHAVHHSINEAFWPKLQDAAATEELEADVWFRVDRSGLPTKSDVGGSAALGAAAQAQLESRIRSAAVDLAGQIRAIPSGTARFRRDPLSAEAFGVPKLRVVATADLLKQIGDLPMVWQILPDPGPFKPHADAYFYVDREDTLDNAGWDGTGRTVALLEYSKPDSTWNLNLGNGTNCTTDAGPAFKCYSDGCPGTFRSHARKVAGIVRSSALSFGGMADDVTTIFANFECDGNITNAINWATDNGASVVNQSSGGPAGSPQNTNDMFLDYKALNFPYPTIVASAGNQGISYRVSNNLRNGLVVGGANDHGINNRAGVTMYGENLPLEGSNSANWYDAGGWELPHIVAPAGFVTSAGYAPNTTEELIMGTSSSAAQLSGIVASLQELNPNLTVYWEPTVPGLMVSANENVDEYYGG